ncbi:MAG: hypothetical protein ABIH91_02190, partial [Candidatus Omnitrophota bacterium]
MLYPCSCPVQQDGGIARRGSLIKKLRKIDPQLLLLDCGNFTAGGVLDEYAQNAQLDMQRSEVNFKAMRLMRYDAVGIGVGEFNFGKDFFLKNARNSNPTYLSANLETDKVLPYLIKNTGGVKIGIIGLTGLSVNAKSEGLKASAPGKVAQIVKSLKDKGVGVVILLSTLGEQEDLKLISKIKGIDILFVGENPLKTDSLTKVDTTFVLRPFWQGRKLGKLNLDIKDGKLLDCKIEELLLADTLADDAQVAAILPRCYSKADCKKEGFVVNCQNPGELKAECVFTKANKVNLRVITLEDCSICNDKRVVNLLKNKFPGIVAEYFYYPNEEAKELIKDFSIQGLPAYIFGNNTFNNFVVTTPGKVLNFEAGSLTTFEGHVLVTGEPGYDGLIYLFSTEEGAAWYSDFRGTDDITYVAIQDAHNISAPVKALPSTNWGNSVNW